MSVLLFSFIVSIFLACGKTKQMNSTTCFSILFHTAREKINIFLNVCLFNSKKTKDERQNRVHHLKLEYTITTFHFISVLYTGLKLLWPVCTRMIIFRLKKTIKYVSGIAHAPTNVIVESQFYG